MSENVYGREEAVARSFRDELQEMLAKAKPSHRRYLLNAIQKAGEIALELEMAGLVSGEDENSVVEGGSDE